MSRDIVDPEKFEHALKVCNKDYSEEDGYTYLTDGDYIVLDVKRTLKQLSDEDLMTLEMYVDYFIDSYNKIGKEIPNGIDNLICILNHLRVVKRS